MTKVCYVLTHNPDTTGGIETVVKNLSTGSDVRWLGCGGACSIAKGFLTALSLRFSNYDVLHAHDNAGYWLTWLARNKKIIWTAQGLMKNYFEENPPKGWKKRMEACIILRMQSRLIKKSCAVIPINKNISERLQKDWKIQPLEVIHNGVDTKTFRPLNMKKQYNYIWVSTNPAKACLAETIEFSKGKKLLAVGIDGENNKHVRYIKAKREEMPAIYNSAKALIYFSKQPDYPLVVLEAMACGLDVITTETILGELTDLGKPAGSVKLGAKAFKIARLSGKDSRHVAVSMDWGKIRERYKKIHESLVS